MSTIRVKRGTRAEADAAAVRGELLEGEPLLITDEERLAIATSANAYTAMAKESEVGGSGSGDVVGPASAVDNGVALFNGTTGKIIKDGGVLGTGAYGTVTESITDATVGRLLRVGDWGFGGVNPRDNAFDNNNSLPGERRSWTDTINETTSVSLNLPALGGLGTATRSWHVESTGNASGRIVQFATEVVGSGTTKGRTFVRVKQATTWSAWSEIYQQNNILGTVSQSSGVPTGALIEQGSNANGEYVKFADGTMITTTKFTYASGAAANRTATLPATFINTDYLPTMKVALIASAVNNASHVSEVTANTTSTVLTKVLVHTASTITYLSSNVVCNIICIGRWF